MPRGFNVESGSNLSDRLKQLIPSFLAGLAKHPPTKPVTTEEIVAGYASIRQKIEGSDVRAIVNHLREKSFPIGSGRDGYFLAECRADLDSTIDHLFDRESAIRRARIGLEKSFPPKQEEIFK